MIILKFWSYTTTFLSVQKYLFSSNWPICNDKYLYIIWELTFNERLKSLQK